MLRGQREREREEHGVRELQIDSSDIDDGGRRIIVFEEKRGRTSGTKCEWNAFVRFQFDTTNNVEDDDDEGETVALETTSVPARITQKWVRSW